MIKKIDLEMNPKFELMDILTSFEIFYKGFKVMPENSGKSNITFTIRTSENKWVAGSVKSIELCKRIIDHSLIKSKGFKPFIAYCISGNRIIKIKINSLSKDAKEFNAVPCNLNSLKDDPSYYERITLNSNTNIYKNNLFNDKIMKQIEIDWKSIKSIEEHISMNKNLLQKDESLKKYIVDKE